jgi:hypothetical protein
MASSEVMSYANEEFYPLLNGVVDLAASDAIYVRGPDVALRLRASDLSGLRDLLSRLDGRSAWTRLCDELSLPPSDANETITQLRQNGLVIDANHRWTTFQQASSNPASVRRHSNVPASSLQRWHPGENVREHQIDPAGLRLPSNNHHSCIRHRESFSRETAWLVDPLTSEALALKLAYGGYMRLNGCRRTVASAGGLEPIHLLVFGSDEDCKRSRALTLNDAGDACYELHRLTTSQLVDVFVPDPVVTTVVEHGAAAIAVCADPSRIVHKYGDRGWRYALMEAGAVSHEIALQGGQAGVLCRPIGGFLDRRLAAFCDHLVPLLMVLVVVERSSIRP